MNKLFSVLIAACFALSFQNIAWSITITSGEQARAEDMIRCTDNKLYFRTCPSAATPTDTPYIAFTDLTNGPDTGIGDGLGSGAIVTVWGFNFGSTQGTGTIEYCDSLSVCRAGYVYYWKNADGALPGGPANLYESHGMQEIAFSIPDSELGSGTIEVTTDEGTATTAFIARTGAIYHVKSTGNDSTGDGSWANPWLTVGKSINVATAVGTTIYLHDLTMGSQNPSGGQQRAIYNNEAINGNTLNEQYAYTSYPGTQPTASGTDAVTSYNRDAMVFAKLSIFASSHSSVDANGQPSNRQDTTTWAARTTKNGRIIGNKMTDIPGWCASTQQGAINGNYAAGDRISNAKMLGNHIHDYGCEGSDKLHHTTYVSIRSGPDDQQIPAWEWGYNYLKDNHAKNGIHQYDQDANCGDLTTTLHIHNNVVVNQGGAGINLGLSGCDAVWDSEIYNNVLINVGLASDWNGIDVNTSNGPNTSGININQSGYIGQAIIYNNTIYRWNADGQTANTRGCLGFSGGRDTIDLIFRDNICWTDDDVKFIGDETQGGVADNIVYQGVNLYYVDGIGSPSLAIPPSDDTNKLTSDPLLTLTGSQLTLDSASPALGQSTTTLQRYLYGKVRAGSSAIGAVSD